MLSERNRTHWREEQEKGGEKTTTVKIIELIGNSDKSWEDAVMNALKDASQTIRNISGIEIISQNANVENGKITQYRSVVKIAFGYERE